MTDDRRPTIGITAFIADLDYGYGRETLHAVPDDYVKAIWEAGGLPILLPILPSEASAALVDSVDGLLLTGGGDVDPTLYGERASEPLRDVDPRRDSIESGIVHRSIDRNRPLLAICRGVQMLNVALGGSLIPDLPGAGWESHEQKAPHADPHHEISIDPGSRIGRVFGRPTLAVNSFHHQAVRSEAAKLVPVAWAPDGLVEAVELRDSSRWVVGVQWHPEMMASHHPAQLHLFRALVEEARASRR